SSGPALGTALSDSSDSHRYTALSQNALGCRMLRDQLPRHNRSVHREWANTAEPDGNAEAHPARSLTIFPNLGGLYPLVQLSRRLFRSMSTRATMRPHRTEMIPHTRLLYPGFACQ